MPLADLLEAIEEEASEEVARLRRDTRREVEAILAAARHDAAAIEAEPARAAAAEVAGVADRMSAQARIDVSRAVREVREEVQQEVLVAVAERLAEVRDEPGYEDLLGTLLREGREVLAGPARVLVDSRDLEIASAIAGELGLPTRSLVEPSWGGVTIEAADGRTVRNTLEARFTNAEAVLRLRIDRALDGSGG